MVFIARPEVEDVMEITLTASETELLLEILGEHQHQLLREIAKSEHRDFKEALKNKEKKLEQMLSKLNNLQPTEVVL